MLKQSKSSILADELKMPIRHDSFGQQPLQNGKPNDALASQNSILRQSHMTFSGSDGNPIIGAGGSLSKLPMISEKDSLTKSSMDTQKLQPPGLLKSTGQDLGFMKSKT